MLKAVFHKKSGLFCGFEISGHAGYGTDGNDIVCAAVSSCTMLVCNAVTENFGANAEVVVENNLISLTLINADSSAEKLLAAFYEHLTAIAEDYSKVKVEID